MGNIHHNRTDHNHNLVGDAHPTLAQSHTQAALNHYQKALTFSPHPATIQERIAVLHWMLWDIPQAMEYSLRVQTLNP